MSLAFKSQCDNSIIEHRDPFAFNVVFVKLLNRYYLSRIGSDNENVPSCIFGIWRTHFFVIGPSLHRACSLNDWSKIGLRSEGSHKITRQEKEDEDSADLRLGSWGIINETGQ